MNFIAAMLLLNIASEEDAFWCLVYIMYPTNYQGVHGKHDWR